MALTTGHLKERNSAGGKEEVIYCSQCYLEKYSASNKKNWQSKTAIGYISRKNIQEKLKEWKENTHLLSTTARHILIFSTNL